MARLTVSRFVQGHRPGRKHTCDQNAKGDVIEGVSENVHGVVPVMLKLACCGHSDVTERRDRTPLPAASYWSQKVGFPPPLR
jgi:hypothetical protein